MIFILNLAALKSARERERERKYFASMGGRFCHLTQTSLESGTAPSSCTGQRAEGCGQRAAGNIWGTLSVGTVCFHVDVAKVYIYLVLFREIVNCFSIADVLQRLSVFL